MASIDRVNDRNANIRRYGSVGIESWMPDGEMTKSMCVFGGSERQRAAVVEQAIARAYGRMGVIVIHNNDQLEQGLRDLKSTYPRIAERGTFPISVIDQQTPYYEPLLGLDVNRAAEVIYPELSRDSAAYMQQHRCCDALKLMLRLFQMRNIPIHLDNLLTLTSMSLEQIERNELGGLPPQFCGDLIAALTQDNMFFQVKADVNSFAGQMDGRIWDRYKPETQVSMITAVKKNAVLAIRVPSGNISVMEYLAAELNALIDMKEHFLLVVDSVNVGDSSLKAAVTNASSNFATLLSGVSIQNLFMSSKEDGDNAIHKCAKVILFQCPNINMAQYYSGMIGNYLRKFVSSNTNASKGAFDIFSGHGKGKTISEQEYARIRPEEMVQLGDGAILVNQMTGEIEVAGRFIY